MAGLLFLLGIGGTILSLQTYGDIGIAGLIGSSSAFFSGIGLASEKKAEKPKPTA